MKVNGTYWKDPSFPSDPDNWVYSPMVCLGALWPCFSAAMLLFQGKWVLHIECMCCSFMPCFCWLLLLHLRSIQLLEPASSQNTNQGVSANAV